MIKMPNDIAVGFSNVAPGVEIEFSDNGRGTKKEKDVYYINPLAAIKLGKKLIALGEALDGAIVIQKGQDALEQRH